MKDKTLKILLGIIALNLTIQTVKDVGLFSTASAQPLAETPLMRVQICGYNYADTFGCAGIRTGQLEVRPEP